MNAPCLATNWPPFYKLKVTQQSYQLDAKPTVNYPMIPKNYTGGIGGVGSNPATPTNF